ncbi:SIMPL domain-containing protein, partial [Sandarakinorhabdus rubra]|uniref:SIMPL domain-containing protein n=1 Tax=Sandarakinorhabdus rubra TaxID=2672568 RepID=UPI0013DC75EE
TAAVAKARARAAVYAAAAGLTVKRIVSLSEAGAPAPGPMFRPMARMAADAVAEATPVEPGELALSAQVTMVFELDAPR